MKKRILIIMMAVLCALSSISVGATSEGLTEQVPEQVTEETTEQVTEPVTEETTEQETEQYGFQIWVNGVETELASVVYNNVHYLPLRPIFEKLGGYVFFRSRDRMVMTITRDGDIIEHIAGSNTITLNGTKKVFENPSILENNTTYLPIDMVSYAFRLREISYVNDRLGLLKPIYNTDYNKIVMDVLNVSKSGNFYPERFKRYLYYHVRHPNSSMQNILFMVNLGLDYPFYQNVSVITNPYDLRVLVNKYNQLPSGFKQVNLVNMNKKYTVNDGKQYLMVGVAYEKFVQMSDAARKEGLTLKAVSTYRTEDYQRRLYNKKLNATGKANADNYSARPGFSEHQTGLAVDINTTKTAFEYSAEFKWLQKHAHEYGYILRYPKDKQWITGYAYEPWHYRYVGVETATIMHREGSSYEQYYAKYVASSEFK